MDITNFYEKYNKLDNNIYTVEEVVSPVNGVYEALLEHDNVTKSTVNVYTGSKLTGDKINTYVLSTPSLTPWKYIIRILSEITPLYITYETTGDEVEAEDINNLQDAVNDTQKALNDETTRAENSEKILTDNLNNEINRAKASENTITNTINTNKPNWDDKYTRNEIDNKFNVYTTNLDWKESVATYSDIVKTYPTPDDGWTVNVKDNDVTYRWSGTNWDAISANSIPLATSSVDGKMSKQDKIDHDDMNSKKHVHSNKGILDVITQSLLDTWNSAYSHISDAVRHITQSERDKWNGKQDNLGYTPVNKAGDTMNGRLTIKQGIDGGIAFPNDSFGGSGDTATITLENPNGGEATEMTFTMTNDSDDIFNFKVSSINGVKVNRNTVWNAGNFNPDSKSDINHTHDDRYYTETEINNIVGSENLSTVAKTLKGAINEIKSTVTTGGSVDNANKLDGKHATDFFCSMNEINNTVDWNTITTPGCYKVQMVSWGTVSNTHSPGANFSSLYPYGLLKVYSTGVSSELRIIQEYYPHSGGDLTPRIRMHNSDDWTSGWNEWTKITKGTMTWNDLKGV